MFTENVDYYIGTGSFLKSKRSFKNSKDYFEMVKRSFGRLRYKTEQHCSPQSQDTTIPDYRIQQDPENEQPSLNAVIQRPFGYVAHISSTYIDHTNSANKNALL